MTGLRGDVMRRHTEPERPAVDAEWRHELIPGFVDARCGACRILVQKSGCEGHVAEVGCHEDVGRGPALEQAPAHLRAIDQRVLRRRGRVIDTAHIHVGAVVQQEIGNRDGLRFVERLLTVSAPRVHERAIGVHESLQLLDPAEPRGNVRRQCRSTGQQKSHRVLVGAVEHGERAVLPVAFHVHVGAGIDERGQHRGVLRGDVRGALAEGKHRIVDSFPDVCRREELLRAGDIAAHAPRRRTP